VRDAWAAAHRAANLPDGPVQLWMTVWSDDGRVLGEAPITRTPSYLAKSGRLHLAYGEVTVQVKAAGRYKHAYIVAVTGSAWRPVARVPLDPPGQQVQPGVVMHVLDGMIGMDFAGGPSDPFHGG